MSNVLLKDEIMEAKDKSLKKLLEDIKIDKILKYFNKHINMEINKDENFNKKASQYAEISNDAKWSINNSEK